MVGTTPPPCPPHRRPAPGAIFNPSPHLTAALIQALADPNLSLQDVAKHYGTSLGELTAWMARPDVQAQLDALESAAARHARLCAANFLPRAVNALVNIVDALTEEELPLARQDALHRRHRARESARRAAWLLFRIARYYAGPPPAPRPPCSPTAGKASDPMGGTASEAGGVGVGRALPATPRRSSQGPPIDLADLIAQARAILSASPDHGSASSDAPTNGAPNGRHATTNPNASASGPGPHGSSCVRSSDEPGAPPGNSAPGRSAPNHHRSIDPHGLGNSPDARRVPTGAIPRVPRSPDSS